MTRTGCKLSYRIAEEFSRRLFGAAEIYLGLGYSVIPLRGSTSKNAPKAPSVTWTPFQKVAPTTRLVEDWFINKRRYGGIGIVTGEVSRLAVMDFDSKQLYEVFKNEYPSLTDTRTIITRRGYHLYYHISTNLTALAKTKKLNGVDWLFEGCYVVAPPSIIDGYQYRAYVGKMPRSLEENDLRTINDFLALRESKSELEIEHPQYPVENNIRGSINPDQLINLYYELAVKKGRNNALFLVSLQARDHKWSQAETVGLLAEIHAQNQLANIWEEIEQRRKEAIRTIASAFSRKPAQKPKKLQVQQQLPTECREEFLRRKQTYCVRVIEGLRMMGVKPHQYFTEQQARDLLDGVVGHHSIRKALTATVITEEGEKTVFNNSPRPPETPNGVALKAKDDSITKCLVINIAKSKKNKRGRPKIYYQMPSNTELGKKLQVKTSISDEIKLQDLTSAKKTRQAVYRTYIERRPGQYPTKWLANRIGVSRTTKCRYDKQIEGLNWEPMYMESPIRWQNLNQIPDSLSSSGFFLRDENGKKYPPKREIAMFLLKKTKQIYLVRRTFNYYWVGTRPIFLVANLHPMKLRAESRKRELEEKFRQQEQQEISQKREIAQNNQTASPEKAHSRHQTGKTHVSRQQYEQQLSDVFYKAVQSREKASDNTTNEHDKKVSSPKKAGGKKKNYRRKFRDEALEQKARTLCNIINEISGDEGGRISLRNIRYLIDVYGEKTVSAAVKRTRERKGIYNPAGFLITLLRSEANTERLMS